jgi:hypothetical protein
MACLPSAEACVAITTATGRPELTACCRAESSKFATKLAPFAEARDEKIPGNAEINNPPSVDMIATTAKSSTKENPRSDRRFRRLFPFKENLLCFLDHSIDSLSNGLGETQEPVTYRFS